MPGRSQQRKRHLPRAARLQTSGNIHSQLETYLKIYDLVCVVLLKKSNFRTIICPKNYFLEVYLVLNEVNPMLEIEGNATARS